MTKPKSKHKHEYQLYLKQREHNKDWYNLCQRCTICGYERSPKFKSNIVKKPDGYYRWLLTKEDFFSVYGELPIVEVL